MTILHIDSDMMVYAVGFACQEMNEEGNPVVAPLPNVLHTCKMKVLAILDAIPHEGYKLYLTGSDNFRYELYDKYKANRKDKPKPVLCDVIRTYLVNQWDAVVINGMEADDAVALALTEDKDAVCVSGDKDLRTVPGKHYNPNKPDLGVVEVGGFEAAYNFYQQMLEGDTADNIPGVVTLPDSIKEQYNIGGRRGVGPKTAQKLLDACETEKQMFELVRECYNDDERMLLNGRLLHMTRELNEDGTPKLWEFPYE